MARTRVKRWSVSLMLALLLLVLLPGTAFAISLDGSFGDWAGQPNIPDPVGDGPTNNTDLTAFYWTAGVDPDIMYVMFERTSANGPVYFAVDMDCDNNGSFGDAADRRIVVYYQPENDYGSVTVSVLDGNGSPISAASGNWGESKGQGGSRAEAGVSFSDLGIDRHQVINMVAMAAQNQNFPNADLAPDGGTITWSPIPVTGWVLLGLGILVVIGLVWYSRGRFMWRSTLPMDS